MADGEMSIFIQVAGEADSIPISLGDTYLPARRFQGFDAIYRETMSITKTLAQFGIHDYIRETTRVIARNPSQDEVRHLRQSAMTPILAVESVDVDRDKRPIVYHETRFAGERVQFVVKRGVDRRLPWSKRQRSLLVADQTPGVGITAAATPATRRQPPRMQCRQHARSTARAASLSPQARAVTTA
jgi:GntR family phosphonate transport system transcriptional regulator